MSARNIKKINEMSFEEALSELEMIVKKLESGNDTLENSITNFERGDLLRKHCDTKLKEAKLKIDKIIEQSEGKVNTIDAFKEYIE